MPFHDTSEGQTHSYGDGCGEPEHNPIHRVRGIDWVKPESTPVSVEAIAEKIYNVMRSAMSGYAPAWVPNGNSEKQYEARRCALSIIEAIRADYQTNEEQKHITSAVEVARREERAKVVATLDTILCQYSEDRPIPPSVMRKFQDDLSNLK